MIYTVARGSLMQPPNSKAVAGNVIPLFLLYIVHKYTRTQKTSYRPLYIFTARAAGIRHSRLYSVNGVRINCSYEKITVLGPPQVFDERILLRFIFTRYIPFWC